MRLVSKLSLNQKLGALALALGALAVFANVAPGHTVTLNAKELLTGVERQEDHVTPAERRGGDGPARSGPGSRSAFGRA